MNKEMVRILLGLKGFIVQPERGDYLNIKCCSCHHSLPLCTHLFWMLGFLQSQKLATVSGWIRTVTTNLTWASVRAHDKHDAECRCLPSSRVFVSCQYLWEMPWWTVDTGDAGSLAQNESRPRSAFTEASGACESDVVVYMRMNKAFRLSVSWRIFIYK